MKSYSIIGLFLYVAAFTIQINHFPGERYAGWDQLFVDAQSMGIIASLGRALQSLELPFIDLHTHFGWNQGGNIYSFFSLPNLLVFFMSPAHVLVARQFLFLSIAVIGAYFYLRKVTRHELLSLFGGIFYICIPYVIGEIYYFSPAFQFYLAPTYLLFVHKLLERPTRRRLLLYTLFSIFSVGACDVNMIPGLPVVIFIYTMAIAALSFRMSITMSLKKAGILMSLFLFSGAYYFVLFFNNLKTIKGSHQSFKDIGIIPKGYTGSSVDFLKFFNEYGFHTFYFPIDGSAMTLYVPAFFYGSIFISLALAPIVFRNEKRLFFTVVSLLICAIAMFMEPVVLYSSFTRTLFPALGESSAGVLRAHINMISFFVLLAGFICFSAINRIKSRVWIYGALIAMSIAADLKTFHHGAKTQGYYDRLYPSSNLIPVHFFQDRLMQLVVLHVAIIGFIYVLGYFQSKEISDEILA